MRGERGEGRGERTGERGEGGRGGQEGGVEGDLPLLVFSFLLSSTVAASKIFEKIKHETIVTKEKRRRKGVRR